MTAYDGGVELGEELRMLESDDAEPMRSAFGRNVKVAVGVALGLAAAAATYTLAPSRSQVETLSISGLQGKAQKHGKKDQLAVEQNLGDLIHGDDVGMHSGRLGASLTDSASKLFKHVVEKADMGSELTDHELNAFEARFTKAMLGMQESNEGAFHDYVSRARQHIEGTKPIMTEALADKLNADKDRTFTVKMQPWLLDESMDTFNSRLIKVPFMMSDESKRFDKAPPKHGLQGVALPESFDPATKWPLCASVIKNPHNQGHCGSCWVFGALGSLDSRICIANPGFNGPNAMLSRGFGASCAAEQDGQHWDGCQGGWPHLVFDYIENHGGIPSTNCVEYFAGTNYQDHWSNSMPAPQCPTSCDKLFPEPMKKDLFRTEGVWNYKLVDKPNAEGIEAMKEALYLGGPLAIAIMADQAFMGYNGGVFSGTCGQQANHAVQALGWGVQQIEKKEEEFILCLNSWGTRWGDNGEFKVATCIPFHYVIPGDITNGAALPVNIPNLNSA